MTIPAGRTTGSRTESQRLGTVVVAFTAPAVTAGRIESITRSGESRQQRTALRMSWSDAAFIMGVISFQVLAIEGCWYEIVRYWFY